jgi:catechol 2,3-dioxygenase-like lactoylglutathione lyase family enzyme
MHFTGLHFFVGDMAATVAFYGRLGIPFAEGAEKHPFVSVTLDNGVALAFATHVITRAYDRSFQPPSGRTPNCLQFDVASRAETDKIYGELTAAGYKGHLAPHDAFWGARYAEVLDPDGNLVGFQSPVDPAKRGRPPV